MRVPWRTLSNWLTFKVIAGIDRFWGRQKRGLALSRVSQVQSLLLNYHDKLQRSWVPLFYLFGMLKNLIDHSRTSGVTHGQEERSGSGAPRDLAGLLESACTQEERPWEIILTTLLHLCVTPVRCMPDRTGWCHGNLQRSSLSSDVIGGHF